MNGSIKTIQGFLLAYLCFASLYVLLHSLHPFISSFLQLVDRIKQLFLVTFVERFFIFLHLFEDFLSILWHLFLQFF